MRIGDWGLNGWRRSEKRWCLYVVNGRINSNQLNDIVNYGGKYMGECPKNYNCDGCILKGTLECPLENEERCGEARNEVS